MQAIFKQKSRLPKFAAAMAAGVVLSAIIPAALPPGFGFISAAVAQEPAQFKSVLSSYGAFQSHARYGEVWVPAREVAPEGWHPYPPCNWVHTKDLGWYYDDKTEWGRIVHHYGRWAHDKELGWVWVAGSEFSPGWVVWRTSDTWVGWAPMPPEQDIKEVSATEFNSDKHWIFVDAKKFSSRCSDGSTIVSAPPALYPQILAGTTLVTEIKFVKGIAVFVLPPPLIINIVDIDINVFPPWSPCFFGAWFWNWNWMMNNVVININLPPAQCNAPPVGPINAPKPQQIKSAPPPPPSGSKPDKRAELPPLTKPEIPELREPPRLVHPLVHVRPPLRTPTGPKEPPSVRVPDLPKRPSVVDVPTKPQRPGVNPTKPRVPQRIVTLPKAGGSGVRPLPRVPQKASQLSRIAGNASVVRGHKMLRSVRQNSGSSIR